MGLAAVGRNGALVATSSMYNLSTDTHGEKVGLSLRVRGEPVIISVSLSFLIKKITGFLVTTSVYRII